MPGLRIALVRSEDTAAALGSDRQSYHDIVQVWEQFLNTIKFSYYLVPEIPLKKDAEPFNLLILPSVTCIGDEDSEAVKDFLRQGKGVLMTWATGVRDQQGRWRKYSLLQEICGVDIAEPPNELAGGLSSFVLLSRPPIATASPPGLSLDLTCYDRPISARVVEERTLVDGVWKTESGSSLDHALHLPDERAAMVHGEYLGGRYVWLGSPLASGVGEPEQTLALRSVMREAILWAGKQVRASKPVWPGGQPSVMSITLNVKTPADIRPELLALARRHHITLTSFLDVRLVMNNPSVLLSASEAGEVALLADVSETSSLDKEYLSRLRKRVKEVTGEEAVGFRINAPVEDETYETLVRAGFEYLSTPDFDRVVPRIVRSHRPIPLLTRPRYLWLVPEMSADPQQYESAFLLGKLSQTAALGGYYCLSIQAGHHPDSLIAHLERLITKAQEENVWITTVGDMKRAWAWWDNIKISTSPSSSGRTSIHISNTGLRRANGITINLDLPETADDLKIESMMLGTEIPKTSSDDGKSWKLRLKHLGAGKNVAYTIRTSSDNS